MKIPTTVQSAGVRLTVHIKQIMRTVKALRTSELYLAPKVIHKVLHPIPIHLALTSVQPPPRKNKPNPHQSYSDIRPQRKRTEPKRYDNAIPSN